MRQIELIKIVATSLEEERVVMKATEDCNLNSFILFDTTYDENGIVTNKHRHMFIFPDLNVKKGDFIWVYTQKGISGNHLNTSKTTTHKLYWNLDGQIWNNSGDKAYIVHYDDWSQIEYKK